MAHGAEDAVGLGTNAADDDDAADNQQIASRTWSMSTVSQCRDLGIVSRVCMVDAFDSAPSAAVAVLVEAAADSIFVRLLALPDEAVLVVAKPTIYAQSMRVACPLPSTPRSLCLCDEFGASDGAPYFSRSIF